MTDKPARLWCGCFVGDHESFAKLSPHDQYELTRFAEYLERRRKFSPEDEKTFGETLSRLEDTYNAG